MSGAGTVLRIVGSVIALAVTVWTTGIGFQLLDPLHASMNPNVAPLGWNDGTLALRFVGLGLIGLTLTIIVWMVFEPVREDVRQDLDRGP